MLNGFDSLPLDEQVRAEAMATGYRRETARQTGATVRGVQGPQALVYANGERLELIRSIAAELRQREAIERHRHIAEPSDLIATMKAEWPDQSAAVRAYAAAEGLSLGEAWARLIGKAVDQLGKGRK